MKTEKTYTEPVYNIDGSDMTFSHYETHTRAEWNKQDKDRWAKEEKDELLGLYLPLFGLFLTFITIPLLLVYFLG